MDANGTVAVGAWYRPLALIATAGCAGLILIGLQPPNEIAGWIVGGMAAGLTVAWWGGVRRIFHGPRVVMSGEFSRQSNGH